MGYLEPLHWPNCNKPTIRRAIVLCRRIINAYRLRWQPPAPRQTPRQQRQQRQQPQQPQQRRQHQQRQQLQQHKQSNPSGSPSSTCGAASPRTRAGGSTTRNTSNHHGPGAPNGRSPRPLRRRTNHSSNHHLMAPSSRPSAALASSHHSNPPKAGSASDRARSSSNLLRNSVPFQSTPRRSHRHLSRLGSSSSSPHWRLRSLMTKPAHRTRDAPLQNQLDLFDACIERIREIGID